MQRKLAIILCKNCPLNVCTKTTLETKATFDTIKVEHRNVNLLAVKVRTKNALVRKLANTVHKPKFGLTITAFRLTPDSSNIALTLKCLNRVSETEVEWLSLALQEE